MRRVLAALVVWAAIGSAWAGMPVSDLIEAYLHEREGRLDAAVECLERALDGDPESAAIRMEIARILASQKRYDDALSVVDEGLARRRNHPELLWFRARVLQAMGRLGEAADDARKAAETGGDARAFALAVRLLEDTERFEEASALADLWVERQGGADAWFAKGRILARLGLNEEARKSLRRALEADPTHRAALRALADLEDREGNLEAAEALYRRAIDANPHDVDARFRLGQILLKQGRTEEALEVFEGAERWSGGSPMVRFRVGFVLLQNERLEEAEQVFRTVAEGRRDDPLAWYLLGVTRLALEDYEGAIEAFERVPPTAQQYPDALVRRAIALESLGRSGEALVLLQDWLKDHPDDEEVILALAGIWEDEGDFQRAVDLLEGYLSRRDTQNHRVFFTLGVLYDKLKDWRKSAEYMKRSLERKPDDPYALNYLGYTYADHGVNLEEAERLILRALELRPEDGFITDSLGWVYYQQGRYEEAAETLRRAVELAPKDPIIWEHLGDALRRLGRDEEARRAYEKALEFAPDSEGVRQKLEELR